MAADSEPESEVFEITDFTTASEWERFISKVEEVLNDWKLIGNSLGKPLEKLTESSDEAAAMAPAEEELKRTGSPEERRQNSVSDFPPPAGRELILRSTVPRPAPYSRALPQRMYSVLTREDFRLAGAFSSDTSFF
uniref:RAB3 GTPase activating protein catalytic subunit 1 n=2 Tax=Equus TaxID=9789 RepID=A0A9L0S5X2_HORSE